jgi:hypothetical protein
MTACPRCSSPLSPGQATCPVCGIPIALEVPGQSPDQTAGSGAVPAAQGAGQAGSQHLAPSTGSGALGSTGPARLGVPAGPALRPGFEVGPNVLPGLNVAAQGAAPALAQPQLGATPAAQNPQPAATQPAAAPQSASTAKAYLDLFMTWLTEVSSLPRNELAVLCLVGLGGALALISFFLPWANSIGMGVGTMGSNPRPGAWGFDTPAGWPIFFITALMLATVVGSDKAQEIMPDLATAIRRLTWIVVPMTLGGGLLGVALMYLTLPYGCGGGLVAMALGACLLIAGSIVELLFPPADRQA